MRKGFEGLYGLVRDRLSCEPLSGHLFLFCNAKRNRFLSVVESCRRLKLSVRDYLAAVLPGFADLPIQRLPDLTPAAQFGEIKSAHEPRRVQLALRLNW